MMMFRLLTVALLISMILISCKKETDEPDLNTNAPKVLDCVISGDMTLSNHNPNGPDYIVSCDVTASSGTLKISAGTELVFSNGYRLEINGNANLVTEGTANDPVRMTSSSGTNDWSGIYFYSDGTNSYLSNTIIENAGVGTSFGPFNNTKAAITLRSGILGLDGVTINESGAAGIVTLGNASFSNYQNVKIRNCGTFPMVGDLSTMSNIDLELSQFDNNGNNAIHLVRPGLGEIYTEEKITLRSAGIPYYFSVDLEIADDFTIEQGTEVIMANGTLIKTAVSGIKFNINGTEQDHVVIRGEKAESGFWGGILLDRENDDQRFSYLDISDGGSTDNNWGSSKANIKLAGFSSSNLILESVTSTRSGICDIAVYQVSAQMNLQNDNPNLTVCND